MNKTPPDEEPISADRMEQLFDLAMRMIEQEKKMKRDLRRRMKKHPGRGELF
ncbi:hypothetical protein [Alteraurantiacibacter lauratis]|uniref:Uncharacterized protein n=1 Tax=Alteraurantiacibacter lauratis TaxID=2054627 RepID=A0ABV7EDQ5_9SPHN